jgi:hypothetical protein
LGGSLASTNLANYYCTGTVRTYSTVSSERKFGATAQISLLVSGFRKLAYQPQVFQNYDHENMAKTTALTQQGAGKGPAIGGRVNVAAQAANLASKLNFGPPKKVAPQQQPPAKGRGVLKPSSLGNTGRGNNQAPRLAPAKSSPSDPNFAATRQAIAAKLNFGAPKRASPPPPPRAATKPSHRVALDRSNAQAGKPSASGGAAFAAQRSALASKLNFRPPKPAEPNHPNIQPPQTRPAPKPSNPVASRAGNFPQVQPVVSEKVDFATQRAAIASKLTSGRHQAPQQNNPNRTQPTRGPPIPANRAVVGGNSQAGTAKNADFAASSAALASKLNFRAAPRPSPPRTNNQEAAQARAVTQPGKQVGRNEESSGRVDIATQAASLASKLKFRPPRPASPKTNEGVPSNGQQPRQPWVPEPVQERLGPNANDRIQANNETNQQARQQQMMGTSDGVPMDPHIAAITQKLHLRNEDSRQREGTPSPRSLHAPTWYDSVEGYDAPRQTESEPEMQYIRSYSVSKLSPPPAEIEPEMKYLRTYSMSKQPQPSQAPPTIEPFRQAIQPEPAVAKRITVVLLDERYEWGTIPKKVENDNGGKNKRKKKKNKKKVTKLNTKKKKGCTIM